MSRNTQILDRTEHGLLSLWFLSIMCLAVLTAPLLAQQTIWRHTPEGPAIILTAEDGRAIRLLANADDDEDGIENSLEINGFTYSPELGLQPWDGDSSKTYYRTDPLRWSSDGDPYSDFMEVSGVNMPAGVPAPENHPLVAARPVINIGMIDYDVIPISEITNTEGGEESSSFTNETSSSDEVGGEVTVGAELNPFKLASVEVTASYSHTWTRTQSSTSSFGTNWSNTRSTNPSQAARLKLRVFMQNLGSATALDVAPTFNLVLGEKTIATITPNQSADRLAPLGLPRSRYPESGAIVIEKDDQNNDIILSLEELKAIQMGAPLALVVTQVRADVARWNPDTQSFDSREEWSSFEGEIDPVVVTLKANLGDDDIRHYQVYVGTDFYNLGFTFRDVLSHVFELEESDDVTFIDGRRYPDDWYVSSPSQSVIDEWDDRGQPENLMGLSMFRNTQMVLMSPGGAPEAKVDMAIFDPDFKRIYVSAFPGNFPILSARARVTINGEQREVELEANANSFYTNSVAFEEPADPEGQVFVENARGDVTTADIVLPALYRDAAEVKAFSSLLPSPGGQFVLFFDGNPDLPMNLYCLFDDPETGEALENPREYLTLPQKEEDANFSDRLIEGIIQRIYFRKVRIDPATLMLDGSDQTFVESQGHVPQFAQPIYGSVYRCNPYGELYANIDLTGTPFHLDPFVRFVDGTFEVGRQRKILNVFPVDPNEDVSPVCGYAGVDGSPALAYDDFEDFVITDGLAGQSVQFNLSPVGGQGYIDMGASNTLEVSDAITLEAWIKPAPHAREAENVGVFLNKEGEYELFRYPDGTIRWALAVDSPHWRTINTHYRAKDDEWVHVALVYDQSQTEPAIRIYINGNLYHGTPGSGPIRDFINHENQDSFRIAGREALDSQYAGAVDEVRVWKIARTQQQIRATIGDTLGPEIYTSAESGLIGYWRFDQLEDLGIGNDGIDDVRDYSVNGNHGDLVGDASLSNITTGVSDDQIRTLPETMVLHQNYPNPFNPQTQIRFELPKAAHVRLDIFNSLGQNVATLLDGVQASGTHTIRWNGRDHNGRRLASAVYVYKLQAGQLVQTRKMLMTK